MAKKNSNSPLPLAIVLLNSTEKLNLDKIITFLEKDEFGARSIDYAHEDQTIAISIGDATFYFRQMGLPIPDSDDHHDHVVIMAREPSSDPRSLYCAMTYLTAAIMSASSAVAVLWGRRGTRYTADSFYEFVTELTKGQYPAWLWADPQIRRNSNGSASIRCAGLKNFGLMPLEVNNYKGDADRAFPQVVNVAKYLIETGSVLKDGDSIGEFAEDIQIVAKHTESLWGEQERVVELLFGPLVEG